MSTFRKGDRSLCSIVGGWVRERNERIRDVYHMLTTYYNPIVHTDVLYNNLQYLYKHT